jgi:hypothetical protein
MVGKRKASACLSPLKEYSLELTKEEILLYMLDLPIAMHLIAQFVPSHAPLTILTTI